MLCYFQYDQQSPIKQSILFPYMVDIHREKGDLEESTERAVSFGKLEGGRSLLGTGYIS